jgi:hypothetical protein
MDNYFVVCYFFNLTNHYQHHDNVWSIANKNSVQRLARQPPKVEQKVLAES